MFPFKTPLLPDTVGARSGSNCFKVVATNWRKLLLWHWSMLLGWTSYSGSFRPLSSRLGPAGASWGQLGPAGASWGQLGPAGAWWCNRLGTLKPHETTWNFNASAHATKKTQIPLELALSGAQTRAVPFLASGCSFFSVHVMNWCFRCMGPGEVCVVNLLSLGELWRLTDRLFRSVQVEEMLETDKTAEPTRNTHTVSEAIEPGLVILIHMIHMIHMIHTRMYSIVFNCIQLYSIVFNCIQLYYSIVFNCIQLYSIVFNSIQLYSIVFNCIQLYSIVFSMYVTYIHAQTCTCIRMWFNCMILYMHLQKIILICIHV